MKKQRIFKLKSKLRGQHVHTTVFVGFVNQTLANCGTLTMNVEEWKTFGDLLVFGDRHNLSSKVILESSGEEDQCNPEA